MGTLLLITAGAAVLLAAVWLGRVHRDLAASRLAALQTWEQLRHELAVRRENVPYLVVGASGAAAQAVEVLGNAGDLAGHAVGVPEVSKAETRLTAALRRLLEIIAEEPELRESPRLKAIVQEVEGCNRRLEFLGQLYNEQVMAFNAIMDRSGAWLVARVVSLRKLPAFEGIGPLRGD
jgi:hypothetical protein